MIVECDKKRKVKNVRKSGQQNEALSNEKLQKHDG
jgi:hypothetical protein